MKNPTWEIIRFRKKKIKYEFILEQIKVNGYIVVNRTCNSINGGYFLTPSNLKNKKKNKH